MTLCDPIIKAIELHSQSNDIVSIPKGTGISVRIMKVSVLKR